MKKIFLILLSVFVFSVNVFSQIVYSQDGRGVQINLEDKSTKILLICDDNNNPYTISVENDNNGFLLVANIETEEGKLLAVDLRDVKGGFEFVTNLDTDDGDDDYYHSYWFKKGEFQDVANVEVRNKNKENIDAEIFRQTIIDNSSELIITGYVSDDELNKTLEDIRSNLKGTSFLDEFEKEQLAWENYKAAHLRLFSNIFDKENPSVEVQNEIKKMNAMRMSELHIIMEKIKEQR